MDILEWLNEKDKQSDMKNTIRRILHIAAIALPCIILVLCGVIYVAKSRTIYFWDDATYWEMSRAVAGGALKGHFWQSVAESIAVSDYNYIAALPSALWMHIFGMSRLSYVTGLLLMYLLPSVLITYRLARKISKAPLVAYFAAVFMIPATVYITAIGFVDVGGMLMCLVCYNLYYTDKDKNILRYLAIGVLLAMMMLFRRYYAFFAVSFLTAMVIDCIAFKRKWYGLIAAGGTAAAILLIGFMPFVTGILLKDYGSLYSGYKFSLMTDIRFITRYFGLLFLLLVFIMPLVWAIKHKNSRPIFAVTQSLVCFAMFVSTQTHGQQHLLLYIPALTLLSIYLVNSITSSRMLIAVAVFAVLTAVSPHIDREQPSSIGEIKTVSAIPTFAMKPEVDDNVSSIIAIKRKLDNIIPPEASCSVLASSFTLNDSILRNAEQSVGVKQIRDGGYIKALPEVDSRDRHRLNEIYTAEYVLVAVPPQTHLAPGSQTIVDEAVASFVNETDISEIFEPVAAFDEHIGDIEVRLYHRVGDINLSQRSAYESRLFYSVN